MLVEGYMIGFFFFLITYYNSGWSYIFSVIQASPVLFNMAPLHGKVHRRNLSQTCQSRVAARANATAWKNTTLWCRLSYSVFVRKMQDPGRAARNARHLGTPSAI